jgi:DtxR family Mn-dependent transcriptional regulator
MTTTASSEEYLEAVYKLQQREHPVRISKLAHSLGVAPASVTEMTKRLAQEGYLNRAEGVGVCLTQQGREAAVKTVRKHRLVERFLTDILGLPWEKVHDEACRFEHVVSDEVEEGLERLLGEPTTCPHGFPIPEKHAGTAKDTQGAVPLCELATGQSGKILAVDEEDPAMLSYLASLGLLPQVEIKVSEVAPFGGPQLVEVGGARYALGREVASKVWVVPGDGKRPARARSGARRTRGARAKKS